MAGAQLVSAASGPGALPAPAASVGSCPAAATPAVADAPVLAVAVVVAAPESVPARRSVVAAAPGGAHHGHKHSDTSFQTQVASHKNRKHYRAMSDALFVSLVVEVWTSQSR